MLKKLSLMMIFVVIFSGAMFFGYNQGSEPEPIDKKVEAIKTLEVIGYELVQKYQNIGVNSVEFSVYNKDIEVMVSSKSFIARADFKKVATEMAEQIRVERKIDAKLKFEFNINTAEQNIIYSGIF